MGACGCRGDLSGGRQRGEEGLIRDRECHTRGKQKRPGMGAGKRWQPEREAGKVPHPGHNQGWVLTPGIILPQRHEGSTPPALLTGSLSLETRWCSVRNASLLAAICSPSQAFLGAGRWAGGPTWRPQQGAESRLSPPPAPLPAPSPPFTTSPALSPLSPTFPSLLAPILRLPCPLIPFFSCCRVSPVSRPPKLISPVPHQQSSALSPGAQAQPPKAF